MKESEFNKQFYISHVLVSVVLLLLLWLFAHIPVNASDFPIIQVKAMNWQYTNGSGSFILPEDFPSNIGAFMIITNDKSQTFAFFYSTQPFSSYILEGGNKVTFSSKSTPYNGLYYQYLSGYSYGTVVDLPEFYHSSFAKGYIDKSVQEAIDDIVNGSILTNGKMDLSEILPKEVYSPSIGGVVIKKDSFKEINLKSGVGSEAHGISGNVNIDKEYQIGIDRYTSTGLDLFYNPVPPHYSNSKFDRLRIHVYAQPDISCFYSDGSIFHPSEHNKTFDFDYINRVNFNCTYSVKRSALMDLIKTSLSEINSIRGELADSSDNILITWKLYFRIEGKLSDSNDIIYGDICKVSFNSKFTSHGYDETPTVTIDYGTFNSNDSSDYDFIVNESNESLTLTGSASSGVSWEEGYINNSGSIGSSPIQTAEELMGQIKGIPEIISSLFSFMPPWVLAMYSVGFGLLLVLIGYKLIRG